MMREEVVAAVTTIMGAVGVAAFVHLAVSPSELSIGPRVFFCVAASMTTIFLIAVAVAWIQVRIASRGLEQPRKEQV